MLLMVCLFKGLHCCDNSTSKQILLQFAISSRQENKQWTHTHWLIAKLLHFYSRLNKELYNSVFLCFCSFTYFSQMTDMKGNQASRPLFASSPRWAKRFFIISKAKRKNNAHTQVAALFDEIAFFFIYEIASVIFLHVLKAVAVKQERMCGQANKK